MNILIISPQTYPCTTGGVEIYNYHLAKGLAERGHKVWVLTSCGHNWDDKNISLVRLDERFLLNPTLSTRFHIFLELIRLGDKVDVIHVPYTSNSTLAYPMVLAKRLLDIHYVICIHGGGMYTWRRKTFQKIYFKHADAIVATSGSLRREYERRIGRRISNMIPPAIPYNESEIPREELRKKYGFSDDDKIILSIGSLKKIKGSDTLLHAFQESGKTYIERNNLKLVYAGDGPMKSTLAEKVEKSGLDGYVRFLGNIPHEEIPHIYKLADIYVISSQFEGAPLSLLEAMFNGLPIIGTDVSGIHDLIRHGENGLLFEKENPRDLMEKIKELAENSDLSSRLGSAARKDHLENYGFEQHISRHIELYSKLCRE